MIGMGDLTTSYRSKTYFYAGRSSSSILSNILKDLINKTPLSLKSLFSQPVMRILEAGLCRVLKLPAKARIVK
jgi:hypothetical protein